MVSQQSSLVFLALLHILLMFPWAQRPPSKHSFLGFTVYSLNSYKALKCYLLLDYCIGLLVALIITFVIQSKKKCLFSPDTSSKKKASKPSCWVDTSREAAIEENTEAIKWLPGRCPCWPYLLLRGEKKWSLSCQRSTILLLTFAFHHWWFHRLCHFLESRPEVNKQPWWVWPIHFHTRGDGCLHKCQVKRKK